MAWYSTSNTSPPVRVTVVPHAATGRGVANCSSGAGSHSPSVSAGGHSGAASSVVDSGGGGGSSSAEAIVVLVSVMVALLARTIQARVRKDIGMLGSLVWCAGPGRL
jgi:hypothetical protein